MKKRLFPFIIALSALAVAGSAAFYSVFGLSKLFAGAATQVIIMAGSLEFAKLVSASLLYQYWDTLNKALKGYLMVAVFTLMLITSGGIYGFLSGAYQSTATQSELLDKSLAILNQKQIRFQETKEDLTIEKTQINKSISDLRVSLSNPTSVSWYDAEAEQVITTTSSSTRRALQKELETAIVDRDNINLKLEAVLDSIGKTDMALLEKEIDNEDQRELGPLKYLAGITGWPMDRVVNWFLLLIIFVFDPLAIALVVAANFAFAQIKRKEPEVVMSAPEGMEIGKSYPFPKEWISESEPAAELKQRVKENQDKLKEEPTNDVEPIDEDYFRDLEGYINYIKEEDIENLTYPQFVEKHYPKDIVRKEPEDIKSEEDGLYYGDEDKDEEVNLITTTDDLTEEEIIELSREIAKTETPEKLKPIKPTEKDLEKLSKVLNIKYNDDDVPLDRLTDTTQTLITKVRDKDNEKQNSGSSITYKGRK